MAGKDLADVARGWNMDQRARRRKLLPAGAITFQMDEEDVRRIMAHPMRVIGSDGIPHERIRTRASGAPSRACSGSIPASSAC